MLGGVALGVLSLGGGAALAHFQTADAPVNAAAQGRPGPEAQPSPSEEAAPGGEAAPGAPRAETSPSPSPSRKASPRTSPGPSGTPSSVPHAGKGTFTGAGTAGEKVGTGPLRRYRVQVEDGVSGLSATGAAREVEEILAHPQGWAAHGRGSFQLVPETDDTADFTVFIATPRTADKLCLAEGLDTGGELNCETRQGVVVNLKRWMLGSPTFSGTPAEYRHLIINHEVGHEIGIRTHMACPGRGQLAPVMMQQIKGLKGCVSNAWPYDEDGRYITGPIVP
ncbi:DUF3152 domain-containing protein [Streptomyces sp. MUM 203J]|nr:DUF3152 domain-containing protein [Streptomyces sp. MUM 203J]